VGTDGEAAHEDPDDHALLENQLKFVREDWYSMAKEKDSSILDVRHMGTDRKTTEEDVDNIGLLGAQ
jgi:hypothetical protein